MKVRFAAVILAAAITSCRRQDSPLDRISARYLADLDSAGVAVALARTGTETLPADSLRALFVKARTYWKRAEYLAEFYNPGTSRAINGAPLPFVEEDDPNRFVRQPEGFQVVEERLYADSVPRSALADELGILHAALSRLRQSAASTPLTSTNTFEAIRLELLRVVALGLSGYDSPVAGHSRREAAWALSALAVTVGDLGGQRADRLVAYLRGAVRSLEEAPSESEWDVLAFIADEVVPAARALSRLQQDLGVARVLDSRSWAARADFPTDSAAFDPLDFASPDGTPATPSRRELGMRLLSDVRLSGNRDQACTSCHQPERAYADGRRLPPALGAGELPRNTPTLLNAALQSGSFHDLRTAFLEDQARDVIENPREMHGAFDVIVARLSSDTLYTRWFGEAFEVAPESSVTASRLRTVLADAVRSLVRLNAPFDQFLRGDRTALSDSARRGFNLFMGKARCGTCHFFPLFNGAVPPLYRTTESEVIGVPAENRPPWRLSSDSGRARVIPAPLYLGAIRTTSVRNSALTAPYMHNGVYATLEEVVDFYDAGGGRGLGLDVPNQTLPADSLGLSVGEKRDLVKFLHALSDGRPRGVR